MLYIKSLVYRSIYNKKKGTLRIRKIVLGCINWLDEGSYLVSNELIDSKRNHSRHSECEKHSPRVYKLAGQISETTANWDTQNVNIVLGCINWLDE
jgi:hypothetical protein